MVLLALSWGLWVLTLKTFRLKLAEMTLKGVDQNQSKGSRQRLRASEQIPILMQLARRCLEYLAAFGIALLLLTSAGGKGAPAVVGRRVVRLVVGARSRLDLRSGLGGARCCS